MILAQLKRHWMMCLTLRSENPVQKRTGELYFQAQRSLRNPPLIKKALRYVRH